MRSTYMFCIFYDERQRAEFRVNDNLYGYIFASIFILHDIVRIDLYFQTTGDSFSTCLVYNSARLRMFTA